MTSRTTLKALTLLRSAELTRDMKTDHLRKLAAIAKEIEFSEGEIIYCRGDMGKALYLIQEGKVVIETDVPGQNPVTLNILGPGQFFGWSSLFPPERKMASTRVEKPTRAIAINANQLRAAWRVDHELEYAIVRRAGQDTADRFKTIRQQLADILTLANEG